MNDLFDYAAPVAPFKDIRNQRPSVAEEKAELCNRLNAMLRRSPNPTAIASINQTRGFSAAHKAALKVLKNKDASRQMLESALSSIGSFYA